MRAHAHSLLIPAPNLAFAARMRAFYHLGRFERVAEEARRARSLNPAYNAETARLEVATKLFSGEFADARDRAVELLARNDAPVVRQYLALARYYLGEVAAARELLASNRQSGQPDVRSQASLASIEAAVGDKAVARQRARSIERGSYMDHHVAYSLGAAWAQLGEPAVAVKWLEQAAETGFPCDPWFRKDPMLDPLRADSAFAQLLATVAEHARLP
jgi:tetratricopeptide (TPR) repeat protein